MLRVFCRTNVLRLGQLRAGGSEIFSRTALVYFVNTSPITPATATTLPMRE